MIQIIFIEAMVPLVLSKNGLISVILSRIFKVKIISM
jgi:hypothetical protein